MNLDYIIELQLKPEIQTALKPCPFCGEKPLLFLRQVPNNSKSWAWNLECKCNCFAHPTVTSLIEAASLKRVEIIEITRKITEIWNQRDFTPGESK